MENDNITIEEVKKIANEKRKKTISADLTQKRLENLAKGREVRKQKLELKLAEAKNGVVSKPVVVSAPVLAPEPVPVPVSTPSAPQRKPKSKPRQNSIVIKNIIEQPWNLV